jgi:hypothetical protein
MSASSTVITVQRRGVPRALRYAMLAIALALVLATGLLYWARSGGTSTSPGRSEVPSGPAPAQVVQNQAPSESGAIQHARQIAP